MSRSLDEEYLERVRAYRETEPYRKALRKRAVWVEPLFGEAKDWHGFRRFRLRRLEKVNSEALMIASGQNVSSGCWPSEPEARGERRRWPPSDDPKPDVVVGSMKFGDTARAVRGVQQDLFQQAEDFSEGRMQDFA